MDDAVTIRQAREDDAGAIAALTRAAYAKWVAVIGREPLPMRVDYADAVCRHRFDLLSVGNRLAALIETVPEDGWLLIENVAVHPDFQKRGFGRRLLALAEGLVAAVGLRGVRLYTNKRFAENIRLYEKLGYRWEKETPIDGGTLVHMTKLRQSG
jgi:ribosomal protein S18 acetylase RimI-like enzyme